MRSLARDFSSSRRAPPKAASKPYLSSACLSPSVFMMSVWIAEPCVNGLMFLAMPSGLTWVISSRPRSFDHAVAEGVHVAELPARVDVHQREGRLGRVEGLHRQVQHHGAVLADRIQHDGLVGFGHHLAHDVDALGFEALQMGQGHGHVSFRAQYRDSLFVMPDLIRHPFWGADDAGRAQLGVDQSQGRVGGQPIAHFGHAQQARRAGDGQFQRAAPRQQAIEQCQVMARFQRAGKGQPEQLPARGLDAQQADLAAVRRHARPGRQVAFDAVVAHGVAGTAAGEASASSSKSSSSAWHSLATAPALRLAPGCCASQSPTALRLQSVWGRPAASGPPASMAWTRARTWAMSWPSSALGGRPLRGLTTTAFQPPCR